MTKVRRTGLFLMLMCSAISTLWGVSVERASPSGMVDFKGIYYATRCLFQNCDPYNPSELLRVYQAEGGDRPSDPPSVRRVATTLLYLPTTFLVAAPFAVLSWGPAHVLWTILTAAGLVFAAFLIWCFAEDYAPTVSLFLICILLANTEALIVVGNAAGIAVSLCVIATWCFLRERYVLGGVLCLAVSLALKPHDAGPVWLCFLLVGGILRKRALQTLFLMVALCLPVVLWVTHVAPRWLSERHANMLATSVRGDLNDPTLASITSRYPGMIIDLQTVISVFRDDQRVYNSVSYLVCGALGLFWAFTTLRSRISPARTWLALAVVAPLSMLPVYHRQHDAKLLLLTIPACALLQAKGGAIARLGLLVTGAGIVLTGDIPFTIISILTRNLNLPTSNVSGQVLTVVLTRPMPLILLIMGIFYLWIYARHTDPVTKYNGMAQTESPESDFVLKPE